MNNRQQTQSTPVDLSASLIYTMDTEQREISETKFKRRVTITPMTDIPHVMRGRITLQRELAKKVSNPVYTRISIIIRF